MNLWHVNLTNNSIQVCHDVYCTAVNHSIHSTRLWTGLNVAYVQYVNLICMRMCHYTANNRKVHPLQPLLGWPPFPCSIQGHLITPCSFKDLYLNQQQSEGFMPHSMSWLPIRGSNSCLSRWRFCHHWGVKSSQSRFPLGLSNAGSALRGMSVPWVLPPDLNRIIGVEWELLKWGITSFLAPNVPLQTPRAVHYLTTSCTYKFPCGTSKGNNFSTKIIQIILNLNLL